MLVSQDDAQAYRSQRALFLPPRLRKRKKPDRPRQRRNMLLWSAALALMIMSGLLADWSTIIPTAYAAPTQFLSSTPGHLTAQQYLQNDQPTKNEGKFQRPTDHKKAYKVDGNDTHYQPLPSSEPATMKDQTYTLDSSFIVHGPKMSTSQKAATVTGTAIPGGSGTFQIKGSDGRLEVDLARSSLDFSQATLADGSAPVGQLLLQLHQITGHYQEESSILGSYQIQVVDSQGHEVQGAVLTQPLTVVYHYQKWELSDLHLDPTQIRLSWSTQLAAAEEKKQSTAGLVQPMTNDATTQTLTAQSSVLGGTVALSGTAINAPSTPDLFEANGNNGQYDYDYPLTVVPGPDGFGPQLTLSYSSLDTNKRYSTVNPASDEGEGWTLSLGSISQSTSDPLSTGGEKTWYFLNGVDGISDRLVPNPDGQSTYYETEHTSHLKIKKNGNIWQVWGLDGTYYEFGKDGDSTRTTSAGTYQWDLDKVLAPSNSNGQVKTMFITYYRESPDGGTTTRDSGLKQITYGYATSASATSLSLVAGTIDFHYHGPVTSAQSDGQGNKFSTAYGTNYHCSNPPSATIMRCDDPVTYNSVPPPSIMPTLELDSVVSYVGTDTSDANKAYRYTFTYQDSPYTTSHYDPYTFIQSAASGSHLLTQITPERYMSGAGKYLAPIVFGYSGPLRDGYHDPSVPAGSDGSQRFSGQTFWHYLTFYEDTETGTGARISYATAHANMNGTPDDTDSNGNVIDDRYDPLFCTTHTTCTGNYAYPDDYSWSMQVVTQISALGTDSSGNTTVATTQYAYDLAAIPSNRTPVSSCHPLTGSGVPAAEASCVGDSWAPGYDGTTTPDHDGNWQNYYDSEFRGFNVVYITSPAGNLTEDYYIPSDGWWTPEANGANYNSGQLYQEDIYQGTETLLQETDTYYSGVTGSPYSGINSCSGSLSAIYTPCIVAPLEKETFFYEGSTASNVPWIDTKYTYDDLTSSGHVPGTTYHNLLQQVTTGSNLPSSIYPLTQTWTYTPNNGTDSNGVFHYDVNKVSHSEVDDNSGHVWQCQDTTYDEGVSSGTTVPSAGWPTTVTNYSTCGNSSTALKSYTAYDQYGNVVGTVDPLGAANPSLYSSHGCSVSTVAYVSTSWTAGHYTSCTTYDTDHTADLPTAVTNALGQTIQTSYNYAVGLLPGTITDANGQATSFSLSYNSTGNETLLTTAPGETGSYTSEQAEHTSCVDWRTITTSPAVQYPCYHIDTNTSLYSSAVSQTYYDALGRAVETRTPGPTPGDDTIVATIYNDQNNSVWTSVPFQVTHGSGWLDPTTATDINGHAPAGSTVFHDALGRMIAAQDPNWGSSQEPGLSCSETLTGVTFTTCTNYWWGESSIDPNSTDYLGIDHTDANGHVTIAYANVAGETIYSKTYSGIYSGSLTMQQLTTVQYNSLGEPTSVTVTDEAPQAGQSITSITTTMTYDDLGRLLTETDPDQGTFTATYDPDGRLLSDTQNSGSSSRTVGFNYDLLGRMGCEQTAAPTINWNGACSAGNPLVQNTYDTTTMGTQGSTDFPVGRLTQSVATTYFPDSTSATVTDQFQYDQRGQPVTGQMILGLPSSWSVAAALPTYTVTQSYNDANQPTTTSTSANGIGYTFTQVYDSSNGALQGLSNNSSNTANLATIAYNANALLSQINFFTSTGGTGLATEQFGYDGDLRPTSIMAVWASNSGQSGSLFSQTRSYDHAGDVISLTTTQAQIQGQSASGGTQTENYCYDEQSRLLWAGNSGTQPSTENGTCGSGTLNNTLSGAGYAAGYTYTNLGQIWQGPIPGNNQSFQYLYCNSSAPHQLSGIYLSGTTCATRTGSNAMYIASYDAWGNLSTRIYGSQIAHLSYDQFNRLVKWNVDDNSRQEFYVYDANGTRVLKRSISAGTTSLTVYAFGLQELQYHGDGTSLGGTTNTFYYSLGGQVIGKYDGTNTTFFITDGLGSVAASFSNTTNSAAVLGNQTYEPYGKPQYQQGTMGTNKGYTGQQNDNLSGLDYYGARYYDPVAGIFLSPDSIQGNAQGENPYAYVAENPETLTDPSGHERCGFLCKLVIKIGIGIVAAVVVVTAAAAAGVTWIIEHAVNRGSGTPVVDEGQRPPQPDLPNTTPGVNMSPNGNPCQGNPALCPGADPGMSPSGNPCLTGQYTCPQPDPTPRTSVSAARSQPPIPQVDPPEEGCSFTSTTQVDTPDGKHAIGTLQVGDEVMAYNPQTHKMEAEPILHIWKNTDSDLIDLTITIDAPGHDEKSGTKKTEVIHTTSKHPFLTTDQGFIAAGDLKVGMKVQSADGSIGTITSWKTVQGTKTMYNLEVAQDHTFAVGNDEWIVHNRCVEQDYIDLRQNMRNAGVNWLAGQQAHHVIPCELSEHPLVRAAGDLFNKNAAYNGRALFGRYAPGRALRSGLPMHWYHSAYSALARRMMNAAYGDLAATGQLTPENAFTALMDIINFLNGEIDQQGLDMVNRGTSCLLH